MVILVQERYKMFKESIREVRGRLLDLVYGSGMAVGSLLEITLLSLRYDFSCVAKNYFMQCVEL